MSLVKTLLTRLSKHFILLDFVYDRDIYTMKKHRSLDLIDEEHFDNGRVLCEEMLEPIVAQYGPISISAGCCPDCGPDQLHSWTDSGGAAADIIPHDWVNAGKSPITFLSDIDRRNQIPFDRLIAYSGSEVVCVGRFADLRRNRYALYENIRMPDRDPRRKKAFEFMGYGTRTQGGARRTYPRDERVDWRREENQPIPHTQRALRAQHIRVGRYFTMLDFCRSPYAFLKEKLHVPYVEDDNHFGRATVASDYMRMAAEILDPMVREFGPVSVIRGYEPLGLHDDPNAVLHQWGHHGTEHAARVVFLADEDYAVPEAIRERLTAQDPVREVEVRDFLGSIAYAVHFDAYDYEWDWRSHVVAPGS